MMATRERYLQWLNMDGILAADSDALRSMKEAEIEERFFTELEFGTAGMRGVLGLGSNRMNVYNVRRATQGVADYLIKGGLQARGVAIAFDSRHQSEEFAWETAQVLLANGIAAYLFSTLHSVPQLSFAVRHYACAAGVVITASHNPGKYNGYKLYGETGGQIGPALATAVTERIRSHADFSGIKRVTREEAEKHPLLKMIGEEVDEVYFASLHTLRLCKDAADIDMRMPIVYTPLNGCGNLPVRRILRESGFENVYVVQAQELPDPSFTSVKAPNPEERECYTLAIRLAEEKDAGLILATDPDADRLGAAVRLANGGFEVLTGNQIGCLLLNYILMQREARGTLPHDALCVKSIVSTNLADAIAAHYGVEMASVLTGFRYIGEKMDECRKDGREFLFGFEESYGFLAGMFARDKDAIVAAMLLAEAAGYYRTRGKTLLDALEDIFAQFGYYAERVVNIALEGKEGLEKIRAMMKAARDKLPTCIGGIQVLDVCDYLARKRTEVKTGLQTVLSLPSSDVLMYLLADDAWVCVRPSGTEPKLKLYCNAKGASAVEAQARAAAIIDDMRSLLEN